MRVETVGQEERFREMSEEWDRLLEGSEQDGPFLRHHWLATWWSVFGTRGRLNILTCRDGDGLLGVMPAYVARQGRLVPVRSVRLLGDAHVGSVGLTAFARAGSEAEVFGRFASHLRADRSWDVLDLAYVDERHGFPGTVRQGSASRMERTEVCPRVALPGDWQSYLDSFSGKRKRLRRSMRKLEEQGAEVETVDGPDELQDALGDLVRLNEARMSGKLGRPYAWSPAYRDFTARTIRAMHAERRLRLTFLKVDGVRKAVNYAFRYGDTTYAELHGFETDAGSENLFRPLMGHCIRAAIEEGCSFYDLKLGAEPSKFEWGVTEVRELSRVRVYGPSALARTRRGRDDLAAALRSRSRAPLRSMAEPPAGERSASARA